MANSVDFYKGIFLHVLPVAHAFNSFIGIPVIDVRNELYRLKL